ncbi:MAG TPA: sensor histidine kinase [Saprospiraceae bacterium]|nr:sensor histidine kinase [Saprospiraceae bacterium]
MHTQVNRYFILGVSVLLLCHSMAQSNTTNIANRDQKTTNSRAEILLQSSLRYALDHDSCRFYLEALMKDAEEHQLSHYAIKAHYLLGKHFLLTLQTAKAKHHYHQAWLQAAEVKDYEQQGFASDGLALTYLEERILDSALMSFQHSYQVFQSKGFPQNLWAPLLGMSRVYKNQGNYAAAKKFGDEALALVDDTDHISRTVLLNHMLSLTRDFKKVRDYAFYFDQYAETIDPLKMSFDNTHKIAHYVVTEDPVLRAQEILSVIADLGTTSGMTAISSYYNLGSTYLDLREWKKAAEAFQHGLLRNEQTRRSLAFRHALYAGLIDAYSGIGDHQEALYWFRRKIASEDSIAQSANNALINELQIKYETARKEQTILTQELALERSMRQRRMTLISLLLVAGLAISIFLAQSRRLHFQRTIAQQESELHRQRIQELQHQNKLLSLTAMIAGQEEERKRLANDIHDGLGGTLAMVKIQFERLGELLNDPVAIAEYQRTRVVLEETGNEVRRIAHNMMPHTLMKMGLIPALEDLANNIQFVNGLRVSLKCIDITGQLSEEKEVVLYRITQELCNNVIKHAEASKLLIQLSQYNGTFSLVVEDNGKGFIRDDNKQPGMGITSISSRVDYLNGNLDIASQPGKGTSVTIEFPA